MVGEFVAVFCHRRDRRSYVVVDADDTGKLDFLRKKPGFCFSVEAPIGECAQRVIQCPFEFEMGSHDRRDVVRGVKRADQLFRVYLMEKIYVSYVQLIARPC